MGPYRARLQSDLQKQTGLAQERDMADKGLVHISGATGHQGGAVARELLTAGWRVRAMTRHPDSDTANDLAGRGAEVVQADLDDEAALERALKGVWGALAVQNTWEAGVEGE